MEPQVSPVVCVDDTFSVVVIIVGVLKRYLHKLPQKCIHCLSHLQIVLPGALQEPVVADFAGKCP